MPPDLDSLPRSLSPRRMSANPGGDPNPDTPSDRPSTRIVVPTSSTTTQGTSPVQTHASSPSHSLAAAAAMNAGLQNEDARRVSGDGNRSPNDAGRTSTSTNGSTGLRASIDRRRRRSSIRMNLNLNDPSIPAPGEMQPSSASISGSRRGRSPSIGEVYQELESEQEAQVNRLLNIIRQQQSQLNQLSAGTPAIDDSITTPMSERSASISAAPASATGVAPFRTHSPASQRFSRRSSRSHPASRHNSTSHAQSPMLRALADGGATIETPNRDEAAFYQAEAQNLTRENQMLKVRIRELERQLADASVHSPSSPGAHAHSPHNPSGLSLPPPAAQAEATAAAKEE